MFEWDISIPQTLTELDEMLTIPGRKLIAGGTDLIPRLHRLPTMEPLYLIDLSRLHELRGIKENAGQIEIGALTTHSSLSTSPLLIQCAPALSQACGSVGSSQTRARGTLGGNLVNASPAADSVPPLLCLEASALISGPRGQHEILLNEFFSGPGRTRLQPDEYLQNVHFTPPGGRWGMACAKLGRRNGMAIAVVSVCVLIHLSQEGALTEIRIAVGSAAPTAVRCLHAEAVLQDQPPAEATFAAAAAALQADIAPIDDLRASADYRRHAAGVLLQRCLAVAVQQAQERSL